MPKQDTNDEAGLPNRIPLAERMRPQTLDEVVGQDGVIGDGKIFVTNIEDVMRVRTGDTGYEALANEN